MKSFNHWRLFFVVFCGFVLLIVSGCGKKAPPLPPEIKGYKINAPFDLKYSIIDQKIHLSWQHQIDKENATIKPAGFEIYMARKTVEGCEGCPFKFSLIGFVSMPSLEFTTTLEKGFIYYFRARAVSDDEMRSDYSKTIQFENP